MRQKRARQLRRLATNKPHYDAMKVAWNKLNVNEKEKMYEGNKN